LFAKSLAVTAAALRMLGIGRDERGNWAFPMRDAKGDVLGIRLRAPSGRKWAVTGGKEGLFLPEFSAFAPSAEIENAVFFPEGASDTAALLTIGARAVGRPSALGGVKLAVEYVRRNSVSLAVVVSDADEAGQRGALALARAMSLYCKACIIQPPTGLKDIREAVKAGADATWLRDAIRAAPTIRVAVRRAAR